MESRSHATSEFILPGPPPTTLMTRPFHQHGPCRELWPSHHYCELVYTLDGGARLAIDGNTHEAGPGRVFLIKAKRPHSTIVADNRHFHGIVIHFVPNSLAAYVERIDSESLAQWEDAPSRTVGRLFQRCLQENMELRTGAYQVSDALLNIILVECVRITGSSDPYNCGADDFSDSIKRISSACSAYIGEHYHEQLTLTKVASAISVSPFYLSHVFSKYTGSTFTEYVTDVRMERARALLTGTILPIGQVADRVGYPDVYYFSKVFKKRFDAPPGRFRKGIVAHR